MYINEVLRQCDTLCPNEYSESEKYNWCDELSAMLMQEVCKKYEKVTVEKNINGEYVLPEGVTFEMVDRIIDCGREINKYDFRSYGIQYLYGIRGRFIVPEEIAMRDSLDFVYLKKHEPIRKIIIDGEVTFYDDGFKFIDCDLREGDSVIVNCNGITFENVPILNVEEERINMEAGEKADWRARTAVVPEGTFSELTKGSVFLGSFEEVVCNAHIERIVTDETVCDAPYDRMYIDYINAQICYYQRNYNTYNQHINLFNQRLNSYTIWLQQRNPQNKDGKFINWW